jgi:hypothetical protein
LSDQDRNWAAPSQIGHGRLPVSSDHGKSFGYWRPSMVLLGAAQYPDRRGSHDQGNRRANESGRLKFLLLTAVGSRYSYGIGRVASDWRFCAIVGHLHTEMTLESLRRPLSQLSFVLRGPSFVARLMPALCVEGKLQKFVRRLKVRSAIATDGRKTCRADTPRETVLRGSALPSG